MSELPQRIGDAERDKAVQELQSHHAAGRLDLAEFDERMQRALEAKTMGDLAPLFADLPSPDFRGQSLATRPAGATAAGVAQNSSAPNVPAENPPAQNSSAQRTARLITGLMWPVALIINFAFGWEWWWLMLVPIFVLPVILNAFGIDDGKRGHGKHRKEIQ